MAFTPKVETGTSTGDNTPGRSATQSPRQILPLGFGPCRAVVQWVTPVLRWHYRTTSRSQYAFFTMFGWIALGPVDEIVELIVNDKPYNGVFARRADHPGDYLDFTISKETPEKYRFWWGNTGAANYTAFLQSLVNPTDAPGMVGKTHPDYENIFTIAVQDMEAGQSLNGQTPPIPKVEVRFNKISPRAFSFGYVDHGTHPIGIVHDLLALPRGGRGLPASMFDETDWDAKLQKLMDVGVATMKGTDLFIAAMLAEAKELSELIADILAYIGGWIYERNGKIYIDWAPCDGSTLDETGLRVITEHELADDDVDEDPGDLEAIPSQVIVTGLDLDANPALTEASESAPVPFVSRLVGEPRQPEQLNRPGFTTRTQLKSYATMIAIQRANPDSNFTVQVLRQYAYQPDNVTPLRVGDLFVLNLQMNGGKNVVVRILERSSADAVKVTFKAQREHGTYPQPAQPTMDPRVDPTIDPPADLARFTVAQLPPDLSNAGDTLCAALVERPSQNAQSFDVEFAPTNSFPGQIISTGNTRFAVCAILRTVLASSYADVTVTVDTVGNDWSYLRSMSALEQGDDQLLVQHAGEWFSVGTITALGGGSYTLVLKRARLGSLPVAHANGDVLFIIGRGDIIYLQNADFANVEVGGAYDATTATKWFEIRPVGGNGLQGNWTAAVSLQLRDPTPAAVNDLAARTGTGKIVELRWTRITTSLVQEYHIYRATAPAFADEAEIGQTSGENSRFYDTGVALGTQYRYRLVVETTDEVDSGWSNSVTATPGVIAGVDVDNTPPSNPGAITKADDGTYLADDGTVLSYISFNVPQVPADAIGQTVKRRRAATTGAWETVGQCFNTTGVTTIRQDDLSPNTAYDYGLEAFKFSGATSALVLGTGSPYTAAKKTARPTTPTVGSLAPDTTSPAVKSDLSAILFGCRVTVTAPSDKDIVAIIGKVTFTDTDAAIDYSWGDYAGGGAIINRPVTPGQTVSFTVYNPLASPGWVRIASLDSSGNQSAGWLRIGNANGNCTLALGNMAVQSSSNVAVSAIKTGSSSASSVRQVVARYPFDIVVTLAGALAEESFNVDLTNRGFATKPDGTTGSINVSSDAGYKARYDWDDAGNSSTNAVIKVSRVDGTNTAAGARRLQGEFFEYN